MNEDRFDRMMEGVKQGAEILKGIRKPSRVLEVTVLVPDVRHIRDKLNASQAEFAEMLGISVRTLQNWEQKRRVPVGPARILLELAATYPNQVRRVSRKIAQQRRGDREASAG